MWFYWLFLLSLSINIHFLTPNQTSSHTATSLPTMCVGLWSTSLLLFHHILLFRLKKNQTQSLLSYMTSHLLQKDLSFSLSLSNDFPLWIVDPVLSQPSLQSLTLSYFLSLLFIINLILKCSSCFSPSLSWYPTWTEKSALEAHNFQTMKANQESF